MAQSNNSPHTWESFLRRHERKLKERTRFEYLFAQEVLARADGLEPTVVSLQTEFRDGQGKRRYIDFTITEPGVRIAIEVDGYDKRGQGGMTREEFADWSRREVAMVVAGWLPLRFANRFVTREPRECKRLLELVLKEQRNKHVALEARQKELEHLTEEKAKAESLLAKETQEKQRLETKLRASTHARRAGLTRKLAEATERIAKQDSRVRELECHLAAEEAQAPQGPALDAIEKKELEDLN